MLTIGKLGALSGVSVDTLRYYEIEGLITPTRKSGNGYRLYDEHAVRRLRFIKQAQQCGFSPWRKFGVLAAAHTGQRMLQRCP